MFQCHNQSPEHTQRSDRDQAQDELSHRAGEARRRGWRTTSKYGLSSAIFDYSLFDHLIHFSKRRCSSALQLKLSHTQWSSLHFLMIFQPKLKWRLAVRGAKVRRYLIWVPEGLFIFLFYCRVVRHKWSAQFDCACTNGHFCIVKVLNSNENNFRAHIQHEYEVELIWRVIFKIKIACSCNRIIFFFYWVQTSLFVPLCVLYNLSWFSSSWIIAHCA